MAERYEFEGAEVQALVQEAQAAPVRVMTEAQRYVAAGVDLNAEEAALDEDVDHPGTGAEPGLWLMNDRGIYLRSNAQKRRDDSVAYARGYRNTVQVGEEPFCEYVEAAPLAQVRAGDTLVVTLDEDKVRLSLLRDA